MDLHGLRTVSAKEVFNVLMNNVIIPTIFQIGSFPRFYHHFTT